MKTQITMSTAAKPLGSPSGHKLRTVKTGSYATRKALLYQNASGEISLRWADAPYTSWSAAISLATDSADSPFDCWMDDAGDLFMVYTKATTFDLMFRRISFSAGVWSAGSAITIYSIDDCYYPSIVFESPDRLWVTYTRVAAGSYYINDQKSDDWGTTWAPGAGETLSDAGTSAFSQIVVSGEWVYALYTLSGTKLAVKAKHIIATLFGSEQILATGTGFDEHFHVGVGGDGRVGVFYDHGALKYRVYDGSQWLAAQEIDATEGDYPRVTFSGSVATLSYTQTYNSGQKRILHSIDEGNSFTTPSDLLLARTTLLNLTLFDSVSGSYQDLTTQAASSSNADIFHSSSGTALKLVGDAIYFGHSAPFNYLHAILSSTGSGGIVAWQYYDGSSWVSFTPVEGAYHLTLSSYDILLWDDLDSAPTDWQRVAVNGQTYYFLRAIVTAAYTAGPIGSQITAIPNTTQFIGEG